MEVEDFLEHWGIKGMRWGVRNKKAPVKKLSKDHRVVSEIKKNRPPVLTNKQIEIANKRMNLEQNYNRLNPSKTFKGKEAAKEILKAIGIGSIPAAIAFFSKPEGKALIEKGKAFIGPSIKKGVKTIGREKL